MDQTAIDHLSSIALIHDDSLPHYGYELLSTELAICEEWLMGELLDQPAQIANSTALLQAIDAQPKCCVHLDYHCRNLLLDETGFGIVDFQDARRGPFLYDIASLLRDCYYTFPDTEIARWLEYFAAQHPLIDKWQQTGANMQQAFDFTAIQRHLKAIGIFSRLHFRDAKSSHLPHIAPVLDGLVGLTRQYPALAELHTQLQNCAKALPAAMTRHGLTHHG